MYVHHGVGFRSYGAPLSGAAVRASNADDDLPPSTSRVQVADGVGDLAQRIRPVDHGRDLAGFNQLRQELQVLCVRYRKDRAQPLADER